MSDTSQQFETDPNSLKAWREDIKLALVFLTRLPVKLGFEVEERALQRAFRAFPIIGVLIGALSGLVLLIATQAGMPLVLAATLGILAGVLLTGALHEDGLADVADGFGGGQTVQEKLEIMRDSRIGTYGVIAIAFSLILRIGALASFADWMTAMGALIAAASLSRIAPLIVVSQLNPARTDGLAAQSSSPPRNIWVQGLILAICLFLMAVPFHMALIVLIVSALALWGFIKLAQRQIGGHSGDVCGAAQQVVEIVCLISLAGQI